MSFGEGKQPFERFYSWMVTLIVKHYTLVDVTGDLVWHKQVPPEGLNSCLEIDAR
jgi:hypothetical protein